MTLRVQSLRMGHTTVRASLEHYLPSIVLAGYGLFILSLFARNDLILYINPAYVWPTVVAGIALVAIAAVRLLRHGEVTGCADCAGGTCEADHCGCESHGHTKALLPYAALAVPLLLAALLPPTSLAAFSARQRGLTIAGTSGLIATHAVRPVSVSVDTRNFSLTDWAGALAADPNPKDYLGKPVILTGMVMHDPASVPPGYIMVMRYQITCCIADARPIGMIVRDTSGGALKDGQWVTLRGVMGSTRYQGESMAVVDTKTMSLTRAGNPYMY